MLKIVKQIEDEQFLLNYQWVTELIRMGHYISYSHYGDICSACEIYLTSKRVNILKELPEIFYSRVKEMESDLTAMPIPLGIKPFHGNPS